jgi:MYXO-CTERM domain-containing protein
MGSIGLLLLSALPAQAASPPSARGDITITEFQADPQQVAQYYGEWFEVYNNSGATLDLQGVTFTSSSGSFTVETPLLVGVEDYAVFGVDSNLSENGGVTIDYVYSQFSGGVDLSASADRLTATYGAVVLDELIWTSAWGATHDHAEQASRNAFALEWANDLSNNWCPSVTTYGGFMYGTPGSANDFCSTDPGRDTDGDGYTETDGDCNDDDPAISPSAIDGDAAPYGNANDDANCDGVRDDGITDDDGDGYTEVTGDCDDKDENVFPGAREVADGADNDCNDCVDDIDHDGDGYGLNPNVCGDDCDDSVNSIHPGAEETPYDGIDQDCDGFDECDVDGDGFKAEECAATNPECGAQCNDCDDINPDVNPSAEEVVDGVDNDCDGIVDIPDLDDDGYSVDDGDCLDLAPEDDPHHLSAQVHPDADEICGDLLDNDCDGFFDDKPSCVDPAASATVRGGGICGVTGGNDGGAAAVLLATMGLVFAARRRAGGDA